jgi:hypothetical protein
MMAIVHGVHCRCNDLRTLSASVIMYRTILNGLVPYR